MNSSKRKLVLVEDAGSRTLPSESENWGIGTGADISVRGLEEEAVIAHIRVQSPLQGQPQGLVVQLTEGHSAVVLLNNRRLQVSAWLHDGDRLHCGYTELRLAVYMDSYRLIMTETETFAMATDDDHDVEPTDAEKIAEPSLTPMDTEGQKEPPNSADQPLKPERPARMPVWLYSIMGVASIIVASMLAFIMLAHPVLIESDPTFDQIDIEGDWPAVTIFDRRLMLAGIYQIRLSKFGYEDYKGELTVSTLSDNRLKPKLVKQPGVLQVKINRADPIDSELFLTIDNATPIPLPKLAFNVSAGSHTLGLSGPRILTEQQQIEVQGMGQKQVLVFQAKPNWSKVQLNTQPEGATAQVIPLLDSMPANKTQSYGPTPISIELGQGRWKIEFSKSAYQTVSRELEIKGGETLSLPVVKLDPALGRLKLSSRPVGASLRVDGEFRGVTPLDVELQPGKQHQLTLTLPGYTSLQQDITLQQDEQRDLLLKMKPEYGTVYLQTQPAAAKLWVDGKPLGNASRRLKLSTLPHQLEVRHPGYKTGYARVIPRRGHSQKLSIKLELAEKGSTRGKVKTNTSGAEGPALLNKRRNVITGSKPAPTEYRTSAGHMMRRFTPASFRSGASRREAGRRANEHQRKLRISYPYYLSTTEVTNAEFRRFRSSHRSGTVPSGDLNQDKQPVVNVTWKDAVAYSQWLSTQEGLTPAYRLDKGKYQLIQPLSNGYRLPTEAEWIRAARPMNNDKPARFSWGEHFPPPQNSANLADESAATSLPRILRNYRDRQPVSAPVGSYKASPNGLYDINGNVAEWIHDYYDVYPGAGDREVIDPLGAAKGRHHVVRGPSWRSATISNVRLSYRAYSEEARDDLGFRLARSQ